MTRKCKASGLSKVALILLGIMGPLSQACYGASYATVYNVVDYGADPTGTHDSSPAVTNAISAAGSAALPGGTIYLPTGTFAITGTVAANTRQLNIVGSGVKALRFRYSSIRPTGRGSPLRYAQRIGLRIDYRQAWPLFGVVQRNGLAHLKVIEPLWQTKN